MSSTFLPPSRRPDPVIPSITEQAGFLFPFHSCRRGGLRREESLFLFAFGASHPRHPRILLACVLSYAEKVLSGGGPSANLHLRAKQLLNSVPYFLVRH